MKKAFTLVEVLICIAIVALLAAIAVPNIIRAKCAADKAAGYPETEACRVPAEEPKTVQAQSTCPACVCRCGNDGLIKAGEL